MAWHATKVYVTIVIGFSKHESFSLSLKVVFSDEREKVKCRFDSPLNILIMKARKCLLNGRY